VSSVAALNGTIGDHAGSHRACQPHLGINGANTTQSLAIVHEQKIVLLSNWGCKQQIFQNDYLGKTTTVVE
jgi:hypothetical protein